VGEGSAALAGTFCIVNPQLAPGSFHFEGPNWLLDSAEGLGERSLDLAITSFVQPMISSTTTAKPGPDDVSQAVGYSVTLRFQVQAFQGHLCSGNRASFAWNFMRRSTTKRLGTATVRERTRAATVRERTPGDPPSTGQDAAWKGPLADARGSGPLAHARGSTCFCSSRAISGDLERAGFQVQASSGIDVPAMRYQRLEAYTSFQKTVFEIRDLTCSTVLGLGSAYRPIGVHFETRDAFDVAMVDVGIYTIAPAVVVPLPVGPGVVEGVGGAGGTSGSEGGGPADAGAGD
jgi:hypothetical protein